MSNQGWIRNLFHNRKIRKNSKSHLKKIVQDLELAEIELEDVNFAKKFKVYSQDQIEARYLLTTSFMERLQNLQKVFFGDSVEVSFVNGRILFLIKTKKDFFESASILKEFSLLKETKAFFDQLEAIFSVIDILKLDQKIGI